jgi:hypothetical protein
VIACLLAYYAVATFKDLPTFRWIVTSSFQGQTRLEELLVDLIIFHFRVRLKIYSDWRFAIY